jgi:hypothetical protein
MEQQNGRRRRIRVDVAANEELTPAGNQDDLSARQPWRWSVLTRVDDGDGRVKHWELL